MTSGKKDTDKFEGLEDNTGPGHTHAPVDKPSKGGAEDPARNSGSGSSANAPRGDVPPTTDPKNPALHPSGTPGAPTETHSSNPTHPPKDSADVVDFRDTIKEGDYGD